MYDVSLNMEKSGLLIAILIMYIPLLGLEISPF